ncbi:hypothetical protein [Klebsiella variicola]|uniref:hypothetical protein n=1 Tax=Klebsiella variicola TaxID=244366 RepID=UPI0021C98DCC|nr:hypothetical protein [Klebsiella variicola]
MSVKGAYLGFRNHNGTFDGPFLDEEKLTAVLKLFLAPEKSDHYLFPDLTLVIHHIDAQIRSGFRELETGLSRSAIRMETERQLRELSDNYQDLYSEWNFACSVEDKSKQIQKWNDVIQKATPVLRQLRDTMPSPVPISEWSDTLIFRTEHTARMYTEALLVYIYARAAYEPFSLARDPNLRRFCRELKEKVTAQLAGDTGNSLLESAAYHEEAHYQKVGELMGLQSKAEADARLITLIKTRHVVRKEHSGYRSRWSYERADTEYSRELATTHYSPAKWKMLNVLWNIWHRVGQLEHLLDELEQHPGSVDFSRMDDARAMTEKLLSQSADGETPLTLTGPGR